MKNKWIASLLLGALMLQPVAAYADAAVGDSIVTLGANLTVEQKQEVLNYFNPPKGAQQINVTIDEERHYLGNVVPAAQIGNGTHSCAMIVYTEKGSGIKVSTRNINYVKPSAYESALITAGVTDADVKITAPFEVSGTGALTGILKAYEFSNGKAISEEVKQTATKELVTNAKLSQDLGEKKTSAIMSNIKQQIAENRPQNLNDIKAIVDKVLKDYNIQLTDAQYNQLLDTINQFASLNIDWQAMSNNLNKFMHQANDFLNTAEGQSFLQKLGQWISNLFKELFHLINNSDEPKSNEQENQQKQQNQQN